MDKESIELLQAITASNFDGIEGTDTPIIVIPNNSSIISLEQYNESPDRFVAHYKTHIISEFANYSKPHLKNDSGIYINAEGMFAAAIFDHGDLSLPKWGEHRATLKLIKTPAYGALYDSDSRAFSQQGMIDFLIDWKQNIEFDDIDFQNAINLIRRLTIKSHQLNESEQGDYKHNRTALEAIEITSGEQKMPEGFLFAITPYDEFETTEFYCSLRAVADKEKVQLKFRIESLQNHVENITDEFREKIIAQLPESNIHIGTMQHR